MVGKEIEHYRELIELIPKIRMAVRKGMELDSQMHNERRIRIERKFVREGLSLFQGKWTIDIIYILRLLKETYFNQIKRALPEVNSRTLTDRLRFLEQRGIVNRIIETNPQIRVKYILSEFGQGLYDMMFPVLFYFVIPKKYTKV
jgi:DNA-binding HxlR family transcriptional regulator